MDRDEWLRARSAFNHDWLKNGLLMTLARALNVLNGAVLDDSIWSDLQSRLRDWPRQSEVANSLLTSRGSVTEIPTPVMAMLDRLPADVRHWALEVERLRRGAPRQSSTAVRAALTDVDQCIKKLLAATAASPQQPPAPELVKELQTSATVLSQCFSSLDTYSRYK